MNVERGVLSVLVWPIHRAVIRVSGGRLGAWNYGRDGMGMVILTTTGRRSGQPRVVPLFALADGDRWAVVASNAGDDRLPAWYLNLQANPEAGVAPLAGRSLFAPTT